MIHLKTVSVLIPAYNCETSLARCLDSLVYQSYPDFEIIVVNDGSCDRTLPILEAYQAEYPQLITVISRENEGVSNARNTALDHAKGDFIFFIDADDVLEIDALEIMMNEFQDEEVDCVVCGHDLIYPAITIKNHVPFKKTVDPEQAMKLLLKDWQLRNYSWGKCCRKKLFEGLRFEGRCFEDVRLIHRVMMKCAKIVLLPDILYHYTVGQSDSLTSKANRKQYGDWMEACLQQADFITRRYPALKKNAARMIRKNALICSARLIMDPKAERADKLWALQAAKETCFHKNRQELQEALNTAK